MGQKHHFSFVAAEKQTAQLTRLYESAPAGFNLKFAGDGASFFGPDSAGPHLADAA